MPYTRPLMCIFDGEAFGVHRKVRYVEFDYLEKSHFERSVTVKATVVFTDHPKKVFKSRAVSRGPSC